MSNLVARHAFRDLSGLFRLANRADDAPSLKRLLREQGKQHPNAKTIELIVYRSKLFKSDLAESMLDAFSKAIMRNGAIGAPLSLRQSTVEFDSFLPNLGSILNIREMSAPHPENEPLGQLATAVGIPSDVLREMSRGRNRLVPQEMASKVAQAAQIVLRLPSPLEVVRLPPNERSYKPLGAETGREPHKCEDSTNLRRSAILWCQRGAVGASAG